MLRRILFPGVISSSALLLFLIQPMMGKAMLPWFGGSAGVWTTAMLFFQAVLLAGYAYAHWLRRLERRVQLAIHLGLVGFSLLALPVQSPGHTSGADGDPVLRILGLLAVKVGLPYFLLASTGPLVQAWAARPAGAAPYGLFAVSNLASLAALMLYPFVVEPAISTHIQFGLWSSGYAVFAAALSLVLFRDAAPGPPPSKIPPASERWLWAGLAACPSAMWLALANLLSQEIAPVPLLWTLPLSIYLLSFVLCFQHDRWYRPAILRVALPVSWAAMCYCLSLKPGLKPAMLLLGTALFVCCMFCHGELARRRPKAAHLTSFYLWLAAGGAAGGVFVALIAPRMFDRFLELPIAVAACIVLGMRLIYRYPLRQTARLVLVGAAAFLIAARLDTTTPETRLRARNFYGVLQVSDTGSGGAALRLLSSGAIHHGSQFLSPEKSGRPTAYYGPSSGIAKTIEAMRHRPIRGGVIGLGTGTLAAYGRAGDRLRFYEINPAVIAIAREDFRYLSDSAAQIDVVAGDGRLAIAREPLGSFDLLVLDAFSGDSIPTHLLTREAFALYFSRLAADGVLAIHITNQYVDLAPVVRALALDAGRQAELIRSPSDPSLGLFDAAWMVVKGHVPQRHQTQAWSDDYSNLFRALR